MSVTINNPLIVMQKQAEASGEKFTTGTVTFASIPKPTTSGVTIIHNLGKIPTTVIVYPTDYLSFPKNGTDEAKGAIRVFFGRYLEIPNSNGAIYQKGLTEQGNVNTGNYSSAAFNNYNPTDTTFNVGGSNWTYQLLTNTEYTWIAIE